MLDMFTAMLILSSNPSTCNCFILALCFFRMK